MALIGPANGISSSFLYLSSYRKDLVAPFWWRKNHWSFLAGSTDLTSACHVLQGKRKSRLVLSQPQFFWNESDQRSPLIDKIHKKPCGWTKGIVWMGWKREAFETGENQTWQAITHRTDYYARWITGKLWYTRRGVNRNMERKIFRHL